MLILFIVLYSVVVFVAHDACRFPDFVQSLDGERDWCGHLHSEVADGPVEYSVSFDGRLMRVLSPSNVSFQRRCMLKVGNSTYLAAQRDIVVTSDRAPQNRYLCMEFVRRGDGVLQLRTSRLSSRMDPHLCAESQLILDDRPLVDRRHRWRSAVLPNCKLSGGYDIHLYDRRRRRGVCDALDAKTRLEAACGGDDSLIYFRFRYNSCVPSGLRMRVDQVTRCAATWTTDNDAFSVLVTPSADNNDRLDAWCLRRPKRTFGRPFTAFLFSELVCHDRPVVELTDGLMVDMRLSEDWGTSLCKDDYEGCAWDYPDKCTRTADCARTCSMCNDSSPTNCFFGAALNGLWRSSENTTLLDVDASSLTLTVRDQNGHSRSTLYDCVKWHQESSSNDVRKYDEHSVDEHLVVTRPGNGCRPRYACIQFQYYTLDGHSPSVIHFHISASQPWPIYDPLDCSSFRQVSLQFDQFGESDQHFTLLTNSTHDYNYVSCDTTSLPVAKRFVAEFGNELRHCFARFELSPKPANVDIHFQLILDTCCENNVTLDVRCLDRVVLSSEGAVLLITEVSPFIRNFHVDSVLCWLFTDSDAFYLLSLADCHPMTSAERLREAIIRPIATFVDERTLTTTVPATTTTSVLISPPLGYSGNITEYGANGGVYDGLAPDTASNVTSSASDTAATTPTSRRQWVSAVNQTRHDSASQSASAGDAKYKLDVGSPGHSDRSHVGMSSYAHVTYAAAAAAAAVTSLTAAVDVFILIAEVVVIGVTQCDLL